MKKLFTFVCALVCAASLSAKTVYLDAGGSTLWEKDGAKIAAWVWANGVSGSWAGGTFLSKDMNGYYVAEVGANTNIKFVRLNNSVQEPNFGDANANVWNSVETTIPTDGNNLFTISTSNWNEGTWSAITLDTIYYVNVNNWETVKCYAWTKQNETTTSKNAVWPGVDMAKANYQRKEADVYYYIAEQGKYENCQFNCGGDNCKSDDLAWTSNEYYYNNAWFTRTEMNFEYNIVKLCGAMNDWKGVNLTPVTVSETATTYKISIDLEASKPYEFKLLIEGNWYSNNGEMTTDNHTGWNFYTDVSTNCKITTGNAGSYKFTLNYGENKTLSVTYPSSTPTAISDDEVESAPVKRIRNGQVVIVREGVTYNMMGQAIE